MSSEPQQDNTDYADMAPEEELAARLERLLREDHALFQLQLEPGVERLEDEANVVAVRDRNGEALFIEVKQA